MVERWPFKPMAVGSTPTEGVFLPKTVFFNIMVKFICDGSNLTPQSPKGGLAQSVECNVSNVEAPGSKPGFSIGPIV